MNSIKAFQVTAARTLVLQGVQFLPRAAAPERQRSPRQAAGCCSGQQRSFSV